MKIEEIEKTINSIMNNIKLNRQKNNYIGLIENGIACIEYSYQLIDIIVNNEQE